MTTENHSADSGIDDILNTLILASQYEALRANAANYQSALESAKRSQKVHTSEAKSALLRNREIYAVREQIKIVKLLHWKYKELNEQTLDIRFVDAYAIIKDELTGQLVELEGKHHDSTNPIS